MTRPTVVLECPVLKVNPQGRRELWVVCNTGGYWLRDLGVEINVCSEALRARFVRMHWSHPDILASSKTRKKPRKKAAPKHNAFASLGDKPRSIRLKSLSRMGTMERAL